jgi:hypothetical protein
VLLLFLRLTLRGGLHPNSALVVCYLLYLSWVTVFFSLPSCNRFCEDTKSLKRLSVVQSYTVFAFALVILINAKTFGNNPECNRSAKVVLFRPFSAIHAGRIAFGIVTVVIIISYTVMTAKDYLPPPPKWVRQWIKAKDAHRPVSPSHSPCDGVNLESGDNTDSILRNKVGLLSQNRIPQQVSHRVSSE